MVPPGVPLLVPSSATPPMPWSIETEVVLLVVHDKVADKPVVIVDGLTVNESIVTLAGWLTGLTVTLTAPATHAVGDTDYSFVQWEDEVGSVVLLLADPFDGLG